MRGNNVVGTIFVTKTVPQPFTTKQIELVTTFADQAVIAIENTRLLNELRETLAQQTATTDVLKVISSSPGELEPVFKAMLENAVHICEAKFGQMFLCEDAASVRVIADLGVPQVLAEFDRKRGTFSPASGGPVDLAICTRQAVHVADMPAEHVVTPAATLGGARSYLAVPMLKEGQPIGVIAIYRQEVRPFTEKQIALVSNFAAQAVIAIENTRLLNELRESLQQQIATSEVLKVGGGRGWRGTLAIATNNAGPPARFHVLAASIRVSKVKAAGSPYRTSPLLARPNHWDLARLVGQAQ